MMKFIMDRLTPENYCRGFLIDDELMGGVSTSNDGHFAFILRHTTGEYIGAETFSTLEEALQKVNDIPRGWKFELSSQCGGDACQEGNCGTGSCKKVLARLNSCCD